MAHWREMVGQREWFDVADLGGGDLLVQIEATKRGTIEGFVNGRKERQGVVVARIAGFDRPLAMKVNHCKAIVSIHGTGDPAKWIGKWVWLMTAMVNDPSGGAGAKCEAVRIKPIKPTVADIAAAEKARGGRPSKAADVRDAVADGEIAERVCLAIDAARTAEEVEAVIAPHRDELRKMEPRMQTIVSSAKKVRLDALAQPTTDGAA